MKKPLFSIGTATLALLGLTACDVPKSEECVEDTGLHGASTLSAAGNYSDWSFDVDLSAGNCGDPEPGYFAITCGPTGGFTLRGNLPATSEEYEEELTLYLQIPNDLNFADTYDFLDQDIYGVTLYLDSPYALEPDEENALSNEIVVSEIDQEASVSGRFEASWDGEGGTEGLVTGAFEVSCDDEATR